MFLLDFDDRKEAERVLQQGIRRFKGRLLALEKWGLEVGCLKTGCVTKESWVRVVGLPLHLWAREIIRKIGESCGGFIRVGSSKLCRSSLLRVRLLVKIGVRALPNSS